MDIDSIVTPIKIDILHQLLIEMQYDQQKTKFLVDGFTNGFKLGYEGDRKVKRTSPNLPLTVGDEVDLWNKVMKEVKLG